MKYGAGPVGLLPAGNRSVLGGKYERSPPKSAVVPLKTIPDGVADEVLFIGGGIVTTKGTFLPLAVTVKAFPVPS